VSNKVVILNPRRERRDDAPRDIRGKFEVPDDEVLEELGIKPFKKEYRKLRKLVASEDFSSSTASYALTRSLLSMIIQAMPIAEQGVHKYKNERAMYGMNALVSPARELANDLRSFGDQTEMAERIRTVVIQGALRVLAVTLVQELIAARRDLHDKLGANLSKKVDARLKLVQESISNSFVKAEADVAEQISRLLNAR
jgi:hypothetical protein